MEPPADKESRAPPAGRARARQATRPRALRSSSRSFRVHGARTSIARGAIISMAGRTIAKSSRGMMTGGTESRPTTPTTMTSPPSADSLRTTSISSVECGGARPWCLSCVTHASFLTARFSFITTRGRSSCERERAARAPAARAHPRRAPVARARPWSSLRTTASAYARAALAVAIDTCFDSAIIGTARIRQRSPSGCSRTILLVMCRSTCYGATEAVGRSCSQVNRRTRW